MGKTIPSFSILDSFYNIDYMVQICFSNETDFRGMEQYGYLIRDLFFIINWIVLLYTMAHGTTLAFLGYTSQEVIVVPLTQDTLYSDEHSEVLVKVS